MEPVHALGGPSPGGCRGALSATRPRPGGNQHQGAEPPIPIPVPTGIPIPDLSGDGDGGPGVPSPIYRGPGDHPHPHPRFAGDGGPVPIPIPDLPESGIKLSTISGLPQCLTLRLIAQPIKLVNLRKPAMSDDAADYSGTSDSGQ